MIKKTKGFTLVEFIIAMAAGSAVALMVWVLFGPVNNWMFTQYRRAGFAEDSAAVSRIQKETRRIKAPGQIQIFTATQLRFVDMDNNTVTFQLVGSDLMRNTDVLARNVQQLVFTYLDKDGNVTAVAGQIRVIKIKLVIGSGTQTITIESSERIRNLS